jgi:hypothetical protein
MECDLVGCLLLDRTLLYCFSVLQEFFFDDLIAFLFSRAEIPEGNHGSNVVVNIPVPRACTG